MRCFYCINLVNPNIFYLNNNKNLETWRKETNENSRKLVPAKCETWFYLTYQSGENILKNALRLSRTDVSGHSSSCVCPL